MQEQNLGPLPTEPDWADWLNHPCTKRLRYWAFKEREDRKELWAMGNFAAAFTMEMAVKNAGASGACSVYIDIINPDYSQIVIGASDEQVGIDPSGPSSAG